MSLSPGEQAWTGLWKSFLGVSVDGLGVFFILGGVSSCGGAPGLVTATGLPESQHCPQPATWPL